MLDCRFIHFSFICSTWSWYSQIIIIICGSPHPASISSMLTVYSLNIFIPRQTTLSHIPKIESKRFGNQFFSYSRPSTSKPLPFLVWLIIQPSPCFKMALKTFLFHKHLSCVGKSILLPYYLYSVHTFWSCQEQRAFPDVRILCYTIIIRFSVIIIGGGRMRMISNGLILFKNMLGSIISFGYDKEKIT